MSRAIYETTEEVWESGISPYEISNYAKEGRECRHNLKYWERGDYQLGLGAASMVRNMRMSNTGDMNTFWKNAKIRRPCARMYSFWRNRSR
ncbi:MAG: hypothetical protein ACLRMZ_11200 [Blautia marasmi]